MDAPPVRYVRTADGYDIAYAVSGAGEPVVLLPTGMNHIQLMWRQPIFRAFYEAIASHYRLVQFDGRGFGLSSRGLRPSHRISDHIRDLDAVLQELRLDRFLVIAPHHQCHVAVPYILDRPGRVNALVVGPTAYVQLRSRYSNS